MNRKTHHKTQPIPATVTTLRNPLAPEETFPEHYHLRDVNEDRWTDGMAVCLGIFCAALVIGSFAAGWAFHHFIHP